MDQKALYAKTYLMKKYGYTDAQAAGIVGNLIQESSMNTGALNKGDGSDGSNSIGLAQWNGDRARGLHSFTNGQKEAGTYTNDLDNQLDYVHHELNTTESAAGKRLRSAGDVQGATAAMIGYERPQGWSADNPTGGHGWENRLTNAQRLAGEDGTSVKLQMEAQANVGPDRPFASAPVPTPPDEPKSRNGVLVQAYNKITGSNFQVPDSILGMKTDDVAKGFGQIGDFAKTLGENDAAMNQQIAQAASRGRSGGGEPVVLEFLSSVPLNKRKKGALGGLGGYTL